MKSYIRILSLLVSALIVLCSMQLTANESIQPQALSKELQIFQPFLGRWQAQFAVSEDGEPVTDVSHWQRALNGKAIRTLHSINDGAYGGESLIFWDAQQQSLVFYYFTTADFMTTGTIEILGDNRFAAYEDVSGESSMSKGISKVRSISTLTRDKITVETAYLKNGNWTTPETRHYQRTDKQVIFR